jgi:hypothetical protein
MKDEDAVNDAFVSTRLLDDEPLRGRLSSFVFHPSSFVWLVRICRFGLAVLFLFAAGAKLAIIKAFSVNVASLLVSSNLNSARWQWPVTIVVILAEVVAAILLLIPRTVRLGAVWSALLLIGFSGFALYYVYALHGEPLECGCFGGIIASQLGVKTALRNLALLIPVLLVFFGDRKQLEPRKSTKGTVEISV